MNVTIRPWRTTDATALAILANDVAIWNNVRDYFPHPYTLADAEAFISMNEGKTPVLNFAIEADGQLAGGIGLIMYEDVYRLNAETGYWVGTAFTRKGIAAAALRQLTAYAFNNFNIIKLYARVFSFNKASMRVLAKCGFTEEAIHKKAVIKNEKICDEHWWMLLRKEATNHH